MKNVTIYSSASCDWTSREGHFFTALEYMENFKYIRGAQKETTVDRCILTGFIEAVHLIKFPCRLTLVTATQLSFNQMGKPKGRNKELKQLLLDLIETKQCAFQIDIWLNGGEKLRRKLIEIEKVAVKVSPANIVQIYEVN